VIGDWNHDGADDIGVYRRDSTEKWELAILDDGTLDYTRRPTFGGGPGEPLVGDWDGDGKDDIGVYRTLT
jgi:hypothetical protein